MKNFNLIRENNITTVVHVGAHRGEEIKNYIEEGVKVVHWIEPNPELYQELLDFTKGTSHIIENNYYNIACGNAKEELDFHIIYGHDAGHMVGNKGCSSLLRPISDRFKSWYKKTIKVPVTRLDLLLPAIQENSFLSIDTQGYELNVLKGAQKILDRFSVILAEVTWANYDYENNTNMDELIDFLMLNGFKKSLLIPHTNDWGDMVFTKK